MYPLLARVSRHELSEVRRSPPPRGIPRSPLITPGFRTDYIATCHKIFRLRNLRPQTADLPRCWFQALICQRCRRNISMSRGRCQPQRRLRPRLAAAVRGDRFVQHRFIERRVRLRHAAAAHACVARSGRRMAIGVCPGPPSHRCRIEPAAHACQTLRRSLVSGSRLRSACFARRQPAQCSLCRVAREVSVNRSMSFLEFYPTKCAQILCYRTLLAYVQLLSLIHISEPTRPY